MQFITFYTITINDFFIAFKIFINFINFCRFNFCKYVNYFIFSIITRIRFFLTIFFLNCSQLQYLLNFSNLLSKIDIRDIDEKNNILRLTRYKLLKIKLFNYKKLKFVSINEKSLTMNRNL